MDIQEAGHHVKDAAYFHVPRFIGALAESWGFSEYVHPDVHIPLPAWDISLNVAGYPVRYHFQLTKFMVLEVAVAALMVLVFVPLAWRLRSGCAPRGRLTNLLDAILMYLRDQVARPAIGGHDADRFLPYVWNVFFFVLFCNLMGALPWAGSPTGALAVTAALAGISFLVVILAGMAKFGVVSYWTGMVPHMELPLVLAIMLKPMLLVIEVLGLCIKHAVLAVRLLANMFAGHLVLAVIIGFIAATAHSYLVLWLGVTIASVLGAVAMNMLELFVAFLQAYVFAFLSALFIGMAVHPHH